MGFSKQEYWSGLPFPSPMHESEKWKWSRSVLSDSSRPHGLQPTRLHRPWDFPGKSAGVGCQCLLRLSYMEAHLFSYKKRKHDCCDGTDGTWRHYVKWNRHTEKGRYSVILLTCRIKNRERQTSCDTVYMWDLKKMIQRNLFIKQKQTYKHRKQICGYQRGKRRRQWHPTPALLPGKSHGRKSLVGCSPWGR